MDLDGDKMFFELMSVGSEHEGPSEQIGVLEPSRVLVLDARFDHGGVWAGVEELVTEAYFDLLDSGHGTTLDEHNYELHMVLAKHRKQIPLKYACLTDIATGVEKTRNFPLDRAYRIVHGLVGLVLKWKHVRQGSDQHWIFAVRGFEQAQHLATRFFLELARRAADDENIHVLFEGGADKALSLLPIPMTAMPIAGNSLPFALPPLMDHQVDEQRKDAITATLGDAESYERSYCELISYYRNKNDGLEAAKIALRTLCLFNHYGYYHESSSLVDEVLPYFDEIAGDDQHARWNYLGNIIQGLISTAQAPRALRVVNDLAERQITLSSMRAKMHYLLAMIHLRYLAAPDIGAAESNIMAAVDQISAGKDEIDYADYVFLKVFIDNGLAFLRVRQGRGEDALDLCRAGYELLTRELGDDRHKLHRSVLQYNAAQVYVMTGRLDDALEHYQRSIAMDPYYSEYYNEAANILQRQERYEEALSLYDQAMKYSPPYAEVHYNKAICHVHLQQWDAALQCFSFSLELDPRQVEALLLRAEVLAELGLTDAALADYDTVVSFAEDNVMARVNRATIHFERGDYQRALSDMNRVMELEPGEPDHRQNLEEVHKALDAAAAVEH